MQARDAALLSQKDSEKEEASTVVNNPFLTPRRPTRNQESRRYTKAFWCTCHAFSP